MKIDEVDKCVSGMTRGEIEGAMFKLAVSMFSEGLDKALEWKYDGTKNCKARLMERFLAESGSGSRG